MVELVQNENILRQTCSLATVEEGMIIIDKLRQTLDEVKGYGLAAPQIGIQKRVAFVRVGNNPEISMINPVMTAYDPIINLGEGCLSFPDVRFDTHRFDHAVVKDDLHPAGFVCEGIEAVAVQHEVEHLFGILFMDHKVKEQEKVGRNEPCPCGSGRKYKKCCGAVQNAVIS